MTLEQLHELWGVDGPIDVTNLSREASNIPYLHNKYYNLYVQESLRLKKMRADLKSLCRDKDFYYRGILDPEELERLGWKPFPQKLMKAEIQAYVDNDQDVINKSLAIGHKEEIVGFLQDIVKHINGRNFQIKNIIEFEKFRNGVV